MKLLFWIVLCCCLSSCTGWGEKDGGRKNEDSLSQSYAATRKQHIQDVHYDLNLDLTQKEHFQGEVRIQFHLKEAFDLSVDFSQGEVQEAWFNDEPLALENYNGLFINVPKNRQRLGLNEMTLKFTHDYGREEKGLNRFVDPKDKRVYLHSQFTPYGANRMFPCFDQPDLRATFSLKVLAPKEWVLISSTQEKNIEPQGNFQVWEFPTSEKLSPYSFSLHGGPYFIWTSEVKSKSQSVPLRLLARHSLKANIRAESWFDLTQKSLFFFEKYFSTAFPYKKYDQLLVPNLGSTSESSVAATTYNEDFFVFKGDMEVTGPLALGKTVFREMASMWFGNLVSLNWWDDLWFTEGLTTYLSYLGVEESTDLKGSWRNFLFHKERAYRQDQSLTVPAVSHSVADTEETIYGSGPAEIKAGSILGQLAFLIGKKDFKKSIKKYLSTYSYQNSGSEAFINIVSEASGRDLNSWRRRWIETPMLNEMEVHFICKKRKITNFEIYQTGTREYPTLRTHKTKLALFRKWAGVYRLNRVVTVEYKTGRTLVKALIGKACPDIVHPNYRDNDYAIVNLDKKSLKNVKGDLSNINDSFLRASLWVNLWSMVLRSQLDMNQFLEIVEFHGLRESEIDTLDYLLSNVEKVLNDYLPREGKTWVEKRAVWVQFFEQAYIAKISESQERWEYQKLWLQKLAGIAESPQVLRLLEKVLKNHKSGLPLSFKVGQATRWALLGRLARQNYSGVEALIEKEKRGDSSQGGQIQFLQVQASIPSLEKKKRYFNELSQKPQARGLYSMQTIMENLFPSGQQDLQMNFIEPFFESLGRLSKGVEPPYVTHFVGSLAPVFCNQSSSERIKNFMKAEKGIGFSTGRQLKHILFENDRCRKMRATLQKSQRLQASPEVSVQ